jgi:ribosome assembly protein RRB1
MNISHFNCLENPCLSFDVLNDQLGNNRENTPLTCYLVGGTQVDKKTQNQLIVMRLSNMYSIADEKTDEKSDDSDQEDDSDDEERQKREKEKEPVLQTALIRHNGEVNRIKVQLVTYSKICFFRAKQLDQVKFAPFGMRWEKFKFGI